MKRSRRLIAIVAVALCLTVSSSLIWAAARKAAPAKSKATTAKAQDPKEKTSKAGHGGTTIESFKLTSPKMKRDIEVIVLLPPEYAAKADKRYPVLYTLHGRGAPFAVFTHMTTVHAAIKEKPMIIVGFNADTASWYVDAAKKADSQFTTFFFDTLIPSIDAHYRTEADAKKRAVTGFSMGGFGAFHYMLSRPDAFASASGMSSAFEPGGGRLSKDFAGLHGDPAKAKSAYAKLDIMGRIKAAVKRKVKLPPLYVTCGTEDFLLKSSHKMRDLLKELKLPNEYVEGPGAHNFVFWKAAATGVIDFHWRTFQKDYKPAKAEAKDDKKEGGK